MARSTKISQGMPNLGLRPTLALSQISTPSLARLVTGYRTERCLVDHFVRHLQEEAEDWALASVAEEFFYQRGRTDVIAVTKDGNVLAFEAKLTRWRDALQQAYRNRCFAHQSYVVLPERTARLAERYPAEFSRRAVGLCYLGEEEMVVLFKPMSAAPLQPWLTQQAVAHAAYEEAHCA